MRALLIILTALCHWPGAAAAAITSQLPAGVTPHHYLLRITPDSSQLRFEAWAQVTLEVTRPTRSITLHALDLEFDKVELRLATQSGTEADAQRAPMRPKVRLNRHAQTATFLLSHQIERGHYLLRMQYRGRIQTQATGLFAVDYESDGGPQRSLYTQFEAADARRVLPCWDEPAYKARFTLELVVPKNLLTVANMPQEDEEAVDVQRVLRRFAPTPRMSSYLLFFALGDFERGTLQHGATVLGVVTRRGALEQARYALEASREVLAHYETYFDLPYPLPKLDNVAASGSSQFFGAMENWGAILTFEHAVLLDPRTATLSDQQRVFSTAAHEIAHQWFGNLVTMRWWDDLWLNEGFASWMEARTTMRLNPQWHAELDLVSERDRAMQEDALASTHAVVQPVLSVEQANMAFDAISYQKGQAVIHMLEQFVGEDVWRDGVRRYLKQHAGGNTASSDLWQAIEGVSGLKDVQPIAHDFTHQGGVPLVRLQSRCRDAHTEITLTQGEFSATPLTRKERRWRVPVLLQSIVPNGDGSAVVRALVQHGVAQVKLPGCAPVLANAGQTGYFRVQYGAQELAALTQQFTSLRTVDQLGLLADTWALVQTGLIPLEPLLQLARQVQPDSAPQVWGALAHYWTAIDDLYRRDARGVRAQPSPMARLARERLRPALERLGWDARPGEPPSDIELRNRLVHSLSALGDAATLTWARSLYRGGLGWHTLPAEQRRMVWSVVARHADSQDWAALREQARAESSPLAREELYGLLADAQDAHLARQALDLALTGEAGATYSANLIAGVAHLHPEMALDFCLQHQVKLRTLVDANSWTQFVTRLAEGSRKPATPARLRNWAQTQVKATERRAVVKAVQTIESALRARQRLLSQIDASAVDWKASAAVQTPVGTQPKIE